MLFAWMMAMILILFLPVFMWKEGVLLSNRGFIGIVIGFCCIGVLSLIGILTGL